MKSSPLLFVTLSVLLLARGVRAQQTAPIPNPSFEEGQGTPAGWTTQGAVSLDDAEQFAGARSLHFSRDAATLPETRAASARFAVSPGVWELTGADHTALYSPDVSFNVSVEIHVFDESGRELKKKSLVIATAANPWNKFRARFEVPPGTASATLGIEYNKTHGDFWLDDLGLVFVGPAIPAEGGDRRTVFRGNRVGMLFYPGDDVTMEMTLDTPATLSPDAAASLRWEVTDFWGERLAPAQTGRLTAAGKAENGWNRYRALLDLRSLPLKTGWYQELHTTVNLGAPTLAKDTATFAILPEAATRGHTAGEIPFGAHTWNTTVADFYPLAARLGLRHTLAFWSWPATPPYTPTYQPGTYDYDARLGFSQRLGMDVWGIVYPVMNVEHGEKPDYSDEALREGARQSVEKYRRDGLFAFQIGNEPPSWNPEMVRRDVEAYKAVYEAAKKADPTFFCIGSAIGPNEAYFKAGFQPYQDAYNIHAYNDLGALRTDMHRYQELFAKYGGKKPIWSTEIGSNSQGLPRDVIARDLVRKATCFFADGGEFFCWFAVGGMPDPNGERASGFSDSMDLFNGRYNSYMARLDAVAYYHVINAICTKKFVREVNDPDGADEFLFRDRDGNNLLVVWNQKTAGPRRVPLPGVADVTVTSYDGRSRRLDARGEGVNVWVGDDPLLLTFQGPADALPSLLQPSPVSVTKMPATLTQGVPGSLSFKVSGVRKDAPFLTLTAAPGTEVGRQSVTVESGQYSLSADAKVSAEGTPRRATFELTDETATKPGQTSLVFGVPVQSQVGVDVLPVAGDGRGGAGVRVVLSNRSDRAQNVRWKAEIVNEAPITAGTFSFKDAQPATAYFTDVPEGEASLAPHEERTVALTMAKVDGLTIYRVRAICTDSANNPAQRERLVGGFARVPRAKGKIALDGQLDEKDWLDAPRYLINEERQYFYIHEAKRWGGPKDLSGTLRFLWDDDYLYVGVEVTDDVFLNNSRDNYIWAQDSLQFLINPFRQDAQGKGRYDYAMGLGAKGPQVWCNLSADASAPAGEVPSIRLSARHVDPGTGNMVYEVAIPWARLAPFKPGAGRDLGLSMILNEDDGGGRKTFMGWFSGVHLKETDFVGDLILGE